MLIKKRKGAPFQPDGASRAQGFVAWLTKIEMPHMEKDIVAYLENVLRIDNSAENPLQHLQQIDEKTLEAMIKKLDWIFDEYPEQVRLPAKSQQTSFGEIHRTELSCLFG